MRSRWVRAFLCHGSSANEFAKVDFFFHRCSCWYSLDPFHGVARTEEFTFSFVLCRPPTLKKIFYTNLLKGFLAAHKNLTFFIVPVQIRLFSMFSTSLARFYVRIVGYSYTFSLWSFFFTKVTLTIISDDEDDGNDLPKVKGRASHSIIFNLLQAV